MLFLYLSVNDSVTPSSVSVLFIPPLRVPFVASATVKDFVVTLLKSFVYSFVGLPVSPSLSASVLESVPKIKQRFLLSVEN